MECPRKSWGGGRAAKTLIEFDKDHYNQFWLAGYAEFQLDHYDDACLYLKEALQILDADRSDYVQKGPGFQERYLQALGMLIHIAIRQTKSTQAEELKGRYRKKLEFVMKELGHSPIPLGKWEATILAE